MCVGAAKKGSLRKWHLDLALKDEHMFSGAEDGRQRWPSDCSLRKQDTAKAHRGVSGEAAKDPVSLECRVLWSR